MHYCDKCNVEIADNISHCPLCGRNILQENEKIDKESFVSFPDNKIWIDKRNNLMNLLFWAVIIGTIISIVVNLIVEHQVSFGWYVLTGSVFVMVNVVLPIKNKWSFSAISTVFGVTTCLYMLFIELYTHTFGWGLIYVIPLFLLFMTLYATTIMFFRNYYKGFEFVVSLLVFAVFSTAIFIFNYAKGYTFWPSLASSLTSITCFVAFFIFRRRRVKRQFQKKFFM